jgi:hypothetical protein
MPGKSTHASHAVLNAILRNQSLAVVGIHVALFTTLPNDAGAGGVEVSGGAYARRPAAFNAPSNEQCVNSADIIWSLASTNWGNVVGFGLYDAATGGNPWYLDLLPNGPVEIVGGRDQFMIPAGTLVVQET